MTDGHPRKESRQFAAVVADPNAPSGPLASNDVEELLNEFSRQTTIIVKQRLEGLPAEVSEVVREVILECLRDVTPDHAKLVAEYIEKRVERIVESSDRAELAGRTIKLRMHRAALWFANRYFQGGENSRIKPGDQDRPTVRVTPARGTKPAGGE